MKQQKNAIIIAIITLIQIQALIGQTDSTIVESTVENIEESDFNKKLEYKYIDENFIEEKTLFKLGFSPLNDFKISLEDFTIENLNTSFSIEKKIVPAFSIISNNHFTYGDENNTKVWFYSTDIGIRYYYLMNKRMKESRSKNNFHSYYFSMELKNYAAYQAVDYYLNSGYSYYGPPREDWGKWFFNPFLKLSWGIQRRIGHWGFIDAGPYFIYRNNTIVWNNTEYQFNNYGIGFNLLIGFGIGL